MRLLSDVAEIIGIKRGTLSTRLDRGWTLERAINKCGNCYHGKTK